MSARKLIINSGPTAGLPALPALTFAEFGVSTDQNFVLVGTGTNNPHLIQTTHTTIVMDYSETPGIIQNRYMVNPLSPPTAPAYQTNKKSINPSGVNEPADGEVGIVVNGVQIARFTASGLILSGSLSYDGSLGGVILSFGPTTSRPASPIHGFIWHNTTSDVLEWFDGTAWRTVGASGGGGGLPAWENVAANMTAAVGQRLIANTDSGSFTITLPASPADKSEVWIIGDFLTNTLTIAGNGKKIARKTEPLILNEDNIGAHLVFSANIDSWRVVPGA